MFKKYRILKWTGIVLLSLIVIVVSFGIWFKSLIPPKDISKESTQVHGLPYLSEDILPNRGKILAVVTSTEIIGNTGKPTGYELTELSRAYLVFKANGFEVDIASPLGGKPPMILDDDDMGPYDYAFLNDPEAQRKTGNTIPMEEVIIEDYQAVFFAGGKGAMFDFPDNKDIQRLVSSYYQSNKIVGAVCHGPAALVNVKLSDGSFLLKNKEVSSFTNEEELLLISDAASIFPFMLQDELTAKGAVFNEGTMYLENVSHDENLVTGQNPWSTWAVAETMIKQLGYTPKYRPITGDENAIKVLEMYETAGLDEAKALIETMIVAENKPVRRLLFGQHTIVSMMQGKMGRFVDMLTLTKFAKSFETNKEK